MAGASMARKFFSRVSADSRSRRSASSAALAASSSTVRRPWPAHASIFSSRNFWKLMIALRLRRSRAGSGLIRSRSVKPSSATAEPDDTRA